MRLKGGRPRPPIEQYPTGPNIEQTDETDAVASASELREENPKTPNGTPFKVYAAIATDALHQSLREDKTDRFDNVLEFFKRSCAQHNPPLAYDGEIARKAVEKAASYSRAKARDSFHTQFRQIAGRSLP